MSFWDQFQPIDSPIQKEQSVDVMAPFEINKEPSQQDFWSQYQQIEKPETTGESITRNIAGSLGGAFSSAVGLPGDVESLVRGIVGESKNILPTSSKLKERFERVHPELKPKTPAEEGYREIAEDYVLQPGGPLKKLAISAAGYFSKELTKALGGEETAQAGAKMLTSIVGSRIGKKNVKDFIESEYKKATRSIPKGATVDAKRAENYINLISKKINQGSFADWKDDVNKHLDFIKKNIKNGQIPVTALDQAVKDINKAIPKLKDKESIKYLTQVKKATQHELKQYGKKNPQFLKNYKNANAAYAGYAQSKKASEFLKKHKTKLGLGSGAALLADYFIEGPEGVAKHIATLGTAYGIGKSAELTYRIFSNPVLGNYYLKATAAAAAENGKQLAHNLNKLDEGLRKKDTNQK